MRSFYEFRNPEASGRGRAQTDIMCALRVGPRPLSRPFRSTPCLAATFLQCVHLEENVLQYIDLAAS
jgi:hypothetical protein